MKKLSIRVLFAALVTLMGAALALAGEFHDAALRGDIAAVKSLLDGGADVNARDSKGRTPLSKAAFKGHVDVVSLLIEKGADVNSKDSKGWTPLNMTALMGHADVVRILIDGGADVDAKDYEGTTPLHSATFNDHVDAARILIERGANVNVRTSEGGTPLHWAARKGYADVVLLLIAKGAEVNARDTEGITPLHEAALEGHAEVARLLVEKGADVNARTSKLGYAPLHLSAWRGHANVASLLLEEGADANARDTNGWSALHHAVSKGNADVTRLLTGRGSDVDAGPQELSTSSNKLETMLPVGDVVAEVLNVELSERLNELTEKMLFAMRDKAEWMKKYILEESEPGEPLPYHPNFGLTEAEYEEFLQRAETEKRLVTRTEIVLTIERQGSKYRISSKGMLPSADNIVIHADELRVETKYGTLMDPEWKTSDNPAVLIGEWEGYVWKSHEGSVLDGNAKVITLDLLLLSNGKTFMNLRATVTEDGEPVVGKDIKLRFDSTLSR